MSSIVLGRLERGELRKAWTDEAADFTPWLAQKDNLKLLGETIRLELELVGMERFVGPFRADILCKDMVTSDYVLIENQLEWTDHSHLGQLITYAAGLKAKTIVWIARKFTAEHRAALDWLNQISGAEFNFFGLEIEVWRIADSSYAPKFNLVCQPNDWSKRVTPDDVPTEVGAFYLSYWGAFKDYLDKHSTMVRARSPRPQGWAEFAIGRTEFFIQIWISVEKKYLDVSLVIGSNQAKRYFRILEAQKTDIEHELGPLNWFELPERKWCYIGQYSAPFEVRDKTQWHAQFAWLQERLEAFRKTFGTRIKDLYLPDTLPDTELEPTA